MEENILPFERPEPEILIKRPAETDKKFGCKPEDRPTEQLIRYGIVNIDKPSGPTSHQVSAYVQKILNITKAGHSGTLDPKVTGVLPIGLGEGTKIVQALLTAGKEYICIMHLHQEIPEQKIREVCAQFVGKIKQMPPVKSAVKRQWRYRKVYYINILEIVGKDVLFSVGCQAGTYIRKLCLHPQTEIITLDSVTHANCFFASPKEVYTMSADKLEKKKPTEVQRFHFVGKLVKVTMASGISFMVTPEHKMLVSTNEGYVMKPISDLTTANYLVKTLKYPITSTTIYPSDLLDDKYLVDQLEIKEATKQAFIKKYGSIRAMNRTLKFDRKAFLETSNVSISLDHIKKAGIYEWIKSKISMFKTEKGTKIFFPRLTADLFYIIGLIASDGNNTKEKGTRRYTRIKFHNLNSHLISIFEKKYHKLFPSVPLSRTVRSDGLTQLDSSNSFLATLCANLGVKSPHKFSDILPILYLDTRFIAAFLRGYFDGDGTAYYKKKTRVKGTYARISIFSMSEITIKRIHQMLLKLGISSVIFKRSFIYEVCINDIDSKMRFISQVGANHPLKRERIHLIKKMRSSPTRSNMYTGLHYKRYLLENKSKLHTLGGNLHRVLSSQIPITRQLYKRASKLIFLPALDQLCIEKIKQLDFVDYTGFVYDMTIHHTHNFLIETGYISSNCHDIGQTLDCGAHMQELRRTKAAGFDEKTLCTLHDLNDAFHYYQQGNDKFLRSLLQPLETGVKHLRKVWVQDSAVDSLAHGAQLKVPGIVKVHDTIQVDDPIAVMTLKDELVAFGRALMTSREMLKNERGIAVKLERVFMQRSVYPKIERVPETKTSETI